MTEHITASPLTWPEGWKRTKSPVRSRFGKLNKPVTVSRATDFVLTELERMGIKSWNIIISTDLQLRNDGLPRSNQREPDDHGAAVWWKDGDDQRVIALDKYDRIADNLYAIGKTIEAMRGIDRWGGGEILNRTFTGFTALPNPDAEENWRDVLGCHGTEQEQPDYVRIRYMALRASQHPDRGGSAEQFHRIQEAYKQAQREFSE
ncbi:MAG TPA: J domain-containing protein [Gammaproteobacteria bacterium]|nr:J domain-containing protein [Gammaproteobacteria bacterium]